MRTASPSYSDASEFSQWILDLGDRRLPITSCVGESEPFWRGIPDEFLVITTDDKIVAKVDVVYTDFSRYFFDPDYLHSRAILSPTNEVVDKINS